MVKPVYLQDNLSKAWLAQEVVDRMLEGEKIAWARYGAASRERLEYEAKRVVQETEERAGTKAVRSREEREQRKREREKQKRGQQETAGGEEEESDLRRRRPEDDQGKGGKVDVRW